MGWTRRVNLTKGLNRERFPKERKDPKRQGGDNNNRGQTRGMVWTYKKRPGSKEV